MNKRFSFVTMLLLCSLAVLGCDGRRVPVTEFDQGFNQGVETVRDVRQKQGVMGELGLRAAGEIGLIPPDKNKSSDWNAGFRQGLKNEIKR